MLTNIPQPKITNSLVICRMWKSVVIAAQVKTKWFNCFQTVEIFRLCLSHEMSKNTLYGYHFCVAFIFFKQVVCSEFRCRRNRIYKNSVNEWEINESRKSRSVKLCVKASLLGFFSECYLIIQIRHHLTYSTKWQNELWFNSFLVQ